MKEIPSYVTPEEYRCPECGELCKIVPLLNEFDYGPSHVTHGLPGCHYSDNWGDPVSDCCQTPAEDYSEDCYE